LVKSRFPNIDVWTDFEIYQVLKQTVPPFNKENTIEKIKQLDKPQEWKTNKKIKKKNVCYSR